MAAGEEDPCCCITGGLLDVEDIGCIGGTGEVVGNGDGLTEAPAAAEEILEAVGG